MTDDTPTPPEDAPTEARAADGEEAGEPPDALPEAVADEAERLTRRAREAVEPGEATAARETREALLDDHDYHAREREDDVLVLHPTEWVEDGSVRVELVDDTDRAVERPLEAPAEDADFETVDEHNRAVVERVRERHGEVHGANAAAFADFMGNHYLKRVETATDRMRAEFLAEYFPRNAWPTPTQREAVEESLELTIAVARE
jgi:hypothetical protein